MMLMEIAEFSLPNFTLQQTLMSHIKYYRVTHPDAEVDLKDRGPTKDEVRTNLRAHVHVCSTCGESPQSPGGTPIQLKNCARVR
jgi:hypothetical protein